jgi:aspartate/methionine/tyrosine aminotransferase
MLAEFRERRRVFVEGLGRLPGVRATLPAGAFYVFPDVSGTGLDGAAFARRMLEEAGVSMTAGADFGAVATSHVRLSYANSRANLMKALERMAVFLAQEGRG